jgi:hypothetical protein
MPTTYKSARVQGTANVTTYATLYNTGSEFTAIASTITICNTAGTSANYRIALMGSAGTPAAINWIVFDSVVAANDTIGLAFGLVIGNTEFIRVSSSAITVTFGASIAEIS